MLLKKPSDQKSVQRPFRSQSPNLVGSSNLPPRLGPPHSIKEVLSKGWGSTNISSSSISSSCSASSSGVIVHPFGADISTVDVIKDKISCDYLQSLSLTPFFYAKEALTCNRPIKRF